MADGRLFHRQYTSLCCSLPRFPQKTLQNGSQLAKKCTNAVQSVQSLQSAEVRKCLTASFYSKIEFIAWIDSFSSKVKGVYISGGADFDPCFLRRISSSSSSRSSRRRPRFILRRRFFSLSLQRIRSGCPCRLSRILYSNRANGEK